MQMPPAPSSFMETVRPQQQVKPYTALWPAQTIYVYEEIKTKHIYIYICKRRDDVVSQREVVTIEYQERDASVARFERRHL